MTLPLGVIEVTIGQPDELFDRLDPLPDISRHLDERVEQFIVHRAEEKRFDRYALIVRCPDARLSADEVAALSDAIRRYFSHRTEEESAKLSSLISEGRRDLVIGLLFLFICGMLGLLVVRVSPPALGLFVEQGLLILGWVALWRPVDVFLYELRPLRLRRNILGALSTMDVRVECSNEEQIS